MGSTDSRYLLPLTAPVVPTIAAQIQRHLVLKQTVPTSMLQEIKHSSVNFATVNVCAL